MKKYRILLICFVVILAAASCRKRDEATQAVMNDTTIASKLTHTPAPSIVATPVLPTFALSSTPTITTTPVPTITPTPTLTAEPLPTLSPTPIEDQKMKLDENNTGYTIVIDPGHQDHQNTELEPIGPGAKEMKKKVSSGTQGKYTGTPEYEINLEVSVKIRDMLTELGYQVIMIREKNDVDISNAERAEIANENNADVFIRIHCNGSQNSSANGILTICPTKNNPYCSEIYKDSKSLSEKVLDYLCETTAAKNKGVMETDTMSGINWSKVPVTIVEMGYMTNKKEDYKLSDPEYQIKLAEGIVNGIEEYLHQG